MLISTATPKPRSTISFPSAINKQKNYQRPSKMTENARPTLATSHETRTRQNQAEKAGGFFFSPSGSVNHSGERTRKHEMQVKRSVIPLTGPEGTDLCWKPSRNPRTRQARGLLYLTLRRDSCGRAQRARALDEQQGC